jgi:hypothetical protein
MLSSSSTSTIHLHQKQVDKFAAEDIDALPLNRNMEGCGGRRRD